MANILINGFSAKTGGGKSILEDCLATLAAARTGEADVFFVLTPEEAPYRRFNTDWVHVLRIPAFFNRPYGLPAFYLREVPRIVKDHRIDAVLNFADMVLPVRIPQVYVFDWAYAVYPDSVVWSRMPLADFLRRRLKLRLIRSTLRYATIVVAQTPTMQKRLRDLYGLHKVVVVPNPVGLTSMKGGTARDFGLPAGRRRLLCLSNYAPHKNLEILLPLAKRMRESGERVCFVTTLDSEQPRAARALLGAVRRDGLAEWVINVGPVERQHVHALFQQCDALFLPTLLESCCMPVMEAMFNKRSVIISDFDFLRDTAGEAAYYFDPLNVEDACRAIRAAFSEETERQRRIALGWDLARRLNDWPHALSQYLDCLRRACER